MLTLDEIRTLTADQELLTRPAYAKALRCEPRTIKRKPTMVIKTSGGRVEDAFAIRLSDLEQFHKLRSELFG